MRAASLLLALACTRANPAYFPTDAALPTSDPPPDAATPALVPPDAAPPVPDASPPPPDAAPTAADAALVLTEETFSKPVTPINPGGDDFEDPCGDGRVLIGVLGSTGPVLNGLNSVQARCADLARGGGSVPSTARTLAVHGTQGPERQDATCPAGQVVVGFEGTTGQWIDAIYIHCAPVKVEVICDLAVVSIGPITRLPVRLGMATQGTFETVRCEEGKIAVGIRGASGWAVDWFALRCARPQLR